MAIIKTYPLKSNYYGPDRLILSDMQPDSLGVVHGKTKSLTLSSLKSFIGGGGSSFTLTTTGSSGPATLDVNTNILNIPDYSITNPVDGSGTAGRIPKWSDSNTLDDSEIFQLGTNIGVGITDPGAKLDVADTSPVIRITNTTTAQGNGIIGSLEFFTKDSSVGGARTVSSIVCDNQSGSAVPGGELVFKTSLGGSGLPVATEKMRILANGNVGIGTASPSAKLEVSGTARITDLSGSGDRMVVADADGDLSTQAIPSGGGAFSPLPMYMAGIALAIGTSQTYLTQWYSTVKMSPTKIKLFFPTANGEDISIALYNGTIDPKDANLYASKINHNVGSTSGIQEITLTQESGVSDIVVGQAIALVISIKGRGGSDTLLTAQGILDDKIGQVSTTENYISSAFPANINSFTTGFGTTKVRPAFFLY